jgi:hypothetical protein
MPQGLWHAGEKRQREIEDMSVKIRGALKPNGRPGTSRAVSLRTAAPRIA